MRGTAYSPWVRGKSLTELLAVVTILGAVALVAMPQLAAIDPQRVDLAATEIAGAIRFARDESLRTGLEHGVQLDSSTQRVRLYRVDSSGGSPVAVFDVRHPTSKNLYQLDFINDDRLQGVRLQSALFLYRDLVTGQEDIGFLTTGQPRYLDAGTPRMLTSGNVILSAPNYQRQVSVTPMTGKVSLQ